MNLSLFQGSLRGAEPLLEKPSALSLDGLCPIMGGCPTIRRPARQLQYTPKVEGNNNDEEPSSDEDGKASISWLLYCLSAINLLIFGIGLCWLAVKHPYIVTPIAFVGVVLFSVLAFRSKPKKDYSKRATANRHHPYTRFTTFTKLKQIFCKYSIPKRRNKNTQDTKTHSQKTDKTNDNKKGSHYVSPKRKL